MRSPMPHGRGARTVSVEGGSESNLRLLGLGAAVPESAEPCWPLRRQGAEYARNDVPLPIGSATTEQCLSKRYGS